MAKRKKQKIAHAPSVRLFAARLREVRLSRGMTQADLAHRARVSEAYIISGVPSKIRPQPAPNIVSPVKTAPST